MLTLCLIAGFRPHDPAALPLGVLFMALIAVVFAALGTAIGSVLVRKVQFAPRNV